MGIPFEPVFDRMMEAGRHKNASAVARALGVTPQALSNYKKRGDFPAHLVIDFAAKHGLSIDMLINGPRVVVSSIKFFDLVANGISDDERAYIYKLLQVLRIDGLGQVFRASLDAVVEGQEKLEAAERAAERIGFARTENNHDGKESSHA